MAGSMVAFDIGSAQVKLVWYSGKTRKKAAAVELPDGLVSGGEIVSMDAMADFLRQTAKEKGIPRAAAAVVLPASLVYTKTVDVPLMTDAQLAYNLPFEFKDYLTQEKSQYYFDYAVQEPQEEDADSSGRMHLFACATLKKTIEEYRAMFRRAGFRLKAAMPEQSAYAALIGVQADCGEDTCLVDIGYAAISMHILRGRSIVTHRTMDLGLSALIRSIADRRGVDPHLAAAYMRTDFEGVMSESESLDLYHQMAVEIMKAVNFYNYNNRQQTLRKIYLCGGGAAIGRISEAIREATNLEVCPVAELMPEAQDLQEPWLFAKAVGCAMQEQVVR